MLIGLLVIGAIVVLNYTLQYFGLLKLLVLVVSGLGVLSFDVVWIDVKGNFVMVGCGFLNSIIVIFDGDKEIGSVKIDGCGEWVYIFDVLVFLGTC